MPRADRILIFHMTAPNLRHASIEYGIEAVEQMAQEHGFGVDETQDPAVFTDANLVRYDAVVWLNTIGVVLDGAQRAAFRRYVTGGGGWVGVHGPAGQEINWRWYYDELVGTYIKTLPRGPGFPETQDAIVRVEDGAHASTEHLAQEWKFTEEWWNFYQAPRQRVHVLATLDESTYNPGPAPMGADHPIAWCHRVGAGRAWYTNLGHSVESYADPAFRAHLLGGIRYAMGRGPDVWAGPGTEPDSVFARVPLAAGAAFLGEPTAMAVLPDRRVLHASRDGSVRLTTPQGATSTAGRIPVYTHGGDGLLGIAVHPDPAAGAWVYAYYAPPLRTPPGDAPQEGSAADFAAYEGHHQLSRFPLTAAGTLDLAGEQPILRVPADRGAWTHHGGHIDFDADGNLLLATGDDSSPFGSDGFAPLDERPHRSPVFDAQRTSANTADLRGKLLRVTVLPDGGYTVPDGNLFPPDTPGARPEVYAMGLRDPVRLSVDAPTGRIFVGDHGPAGSAARPERGPAGQARFLQLTGPANYGWPYAFGDREPYAAVDFATGRSGEPFDLAAPVNDSPRNTGLRELPPVAGAWLAYRGDAVPEFEAHADGASPMAGPVYRFDPGAAFRGAFPSRYDGRFFAYERERGWIKEIAVGEDGAPGEIRPLAASLAPAAPVDVRFGPDGALYVLDGGGAAGPALYRLEHAGQDQDPTATVTASATSGPVPLEVEFSPAGSHSADGGPLAYSWIFEGSSVVEARGPEPVRHRYAAAGTHTAVLAVTDARGRTATTELTVVAGGVRPALSFTQPAQGQVVEFGDTVSFAVAALDADTGAPLDSGAVTVELSLGRMVDGEPVPGDRVLATARGTEGRLTLPAQASRTGRIAVLTARWAGPGPQPGAAAAVHRVLQPAVRSAASCDESFGVRAVPHPAAAGGALIGGVDGWDWIKFDPVDLTGVTAIAFRVSSDGPGGTIEVQSHVTGGPVLASVEVPDTGGLDHVVELPPAAIEPVPGAEPLYLVFRAPQSGLFTVDTLRFVRGRAAS
ncbi:ThuA domain-containing protein [Streptomyces sp. V4-01]|uniref:ThuA domain-containing protein n=1 Tax=Actinacidiphila polyblastidii TaxID=3110430 RepID=A0ABU7PC32_9ACTN|nr:ThuA domain-containing protein [Streptomyces sp. V4-01]